MKRILSFVIFFLLAFPLFAQTLAYRDEDDSHVQVGTNYYYEGKGGLLIDFDPRTAVALEYVLHKDSGEEIYSLDFLLKTYELKFSIDKNANVYIKTFQDNVITLHHSQTCIEVKQDSKRVSDRSDSHYYYIYPKYIISKEDLQTLMNEGIKKLSFMTTRGYHVLNYEKDTIGTILVKENELLLGKTNFSEGF